MLTIRSFWRQTPRVWRFAIFVAVAWPMLAWLAAEALIVNAEPTNADAMVVLAGSSTCIERTHQAAQLFKDGRAPKIILTNDNQKSGWSAELQTNPLYVQRAASELKSCGVPEEKIEIVPETVSSTREETARVREYAASNGLRSILVVTSAYQVRRARWTFAQMFAGSGVFVSFSSVPPGDQTPRPLTWWLHRRGWRMVAGEYVKLAYYFIRGVKFTETAQAASRESVEPQDRSGLKTDRGVYRKPPLPPLPRVGGKFIDPVFGTEIMRATDESDGPAPGLGTYYSHWPTFNCDNTRLLIRKGETGEAIIKQFDPVSFRVSPGSITLPVSIPAGGVPQWESAIWSNRDPNVIYTFPNYYDGGMKLYTYHIVKKTFRLIKDFESLSGGKDYLKQMYMSADDDVFCWLHHRVGDDGEPIAYIVYKRSTDKVLYHNPATVYAGGINEVHVDKSGKWLHIVIPTKQSDGTGTRFLNLQTGAYQILRREVDHSPGHGDLGTEIIVGGDDYLAGISFRNLNNVHSYYQVLTFKTAQGVVNWTNDFHGTMLADNEGWMTVGFYHDPDVKLPNSGLFEDEILQVALDGSQRIRRICHTRCAIDNRTGTTGYGAAPKPTISKDGRFIAFTSNWEKSGRYDLFIVRIEPAPRLNQPRPAPSPALQRPRRARPA
jgi:uncharacterized SAM-binding protein YcdF (DUF218 family)